MSPLTSTPNVSSPRRVSEDEATLGFVLSRGRTRVSLIGEYLDQNQTERWTFSQPAVANPAFTESEDSTET